MTAAQVDINKEQIQVKRIDGVESGYATLTGECT
jgi:hypothetical protein